jgi:hypothetical protein
LNFPRTGQDGEREARKARKRGLDENRARRGQHRNGRLIVHLKISRADSSSQQDFAIADTAMSSSDGVLDDIHALLYNVLYKSE